MRYEEDDIWIVHSLRRHYPDQVKGPELRFASISAGNGSQRPCVRLSAVMVIVSQRDGPCQACSFLYPLPLLYVPFEWVHDWILLDTCRPAWYPEDDFLYTLHNPSGGLSMKKLQFAMVGGGNGALIGDIHRIGSQFDDLRDRQGHHCPRLPHCLRQTRHLHQPGVGGAEGPGPGKRSSVRRVLQLCPLRHSGAGQKDDR